MLKDELLALQSYDAIEHVLPSRTLAKWQAVHVLVALENKCAILSHQTGLGKTTLAIALMKLLRNANPEMKFIFVGTRRQETQAVAEFKSLGGFSTTFISAENSAVSVAQKLKFLGTDILFLTHESLNRVEIMRELLPHVGRFGCVFGDEAHLLGNFREAMSAWMFNCLCRRCEYRYALTATPMTTHAAQISDLCYTLDWETFPDPNALKNKLLGGMVLKEQYPNFYISYDRRDLGIENQYLVFLELVKPTQRQVGARGADLFRLTRGEEAEPQRKALADLLVRLKSEGKKGLVFVYHHEYRKMLLEYLEGRDDFGLRYDCIHGLTDVRKSAQIQRAFNAGELDCVFTSITTNMNLDCDYVVLYEYTADLRQMVGRGERGLVPKSLEVHFLFTVETGEVNYFINTVWSRSDFIQNVLSKDYDFIVRLGEYLDAQGLVDHDNLDFK